MAGLISTYSTSSWPAVFEGCRVRQSQQQQSDTIEPEVAVAGLDAAIHAFLLGPGYLVSKTWMPGSSPGKVCCRLHGRL